MPPELRYLLWGLLLGSGVLTVIPYSLLLLVLAGQMASGVVVGAASGAIVGAVRESAIVPPLLAGAGAAEPSRLMELLPRFRTLARRANTSLVAAGALALILAGR